MACSIAVWLSDDAELALQLADILLQQVVGDLAR